MDETTKNFLDKLTTEEETNAELVKSGSAVAKSSKLDEDSWEEGEGQLTVDVYQTPDEIVIESPIAGVNLDDLDISITSESVTIRGKRERERKARIEDYLCQECYWGKFSRSVILPQEIDTEKVEASFKNGVLTMHLPKLTKTKPRKIKVRLD